jgi:dynein heavy chain
MINSFFAFSYAWGLGGSLDSIDKEKFDNMVIREQFKIPPGHTTFDYFFDAKKDKTFKQWNTKVPQFVYDKDLSYFDLIVPTTDTAKYSFLIDALLTI